MKYYERHRRKVGLLLSQLSGEQAYLLAEILELTMQAIWAKYGDAMADYQGRCRPDEPSLWEPLPACNNPSCEYKDS